MKAEILSTGDEIRSGALIDSNSAHVALGLEEYGVQVVRHSCAGDDLDILVSVLTEIGARSEVAVVTGGLGPTADDMTAAAAAAAAGVELALSETALDWVENAFRIRKRPMSDSNRKQAMLPAGAEPLYNPVGTAPGFLLKINQCFFFFLPGVPLEMRRMMSETILPRIEAMQGRDRAFNRVRTITTFGLGESVTGEMLSGLTDRFPEIKLGLRAKFPQVHVRLYIRGRDEESLNRILDEGAAWVAEKIGERVISTEGASMEAVIGDLLKQKNATIAVAES
ncbi:MAG: competence/damage-inducible protein A, partial [Deltaproteobacteria bacterium]|nr:competence/damage-inducible protein A [Deltaproteobacteria bacterium]